MALKKLEDLPVGESKELDAAATAVAAVQAAAAAAPVVAATAPVAAPATAPAAPTEEEIKEANFQLVC